LARGYFKKAKNPRSKDNFYGTTQKPLGGWTRNIMSGRKRVSSFPRRQPKVQKLVFSHQVFFENQRPMAAAFQYDRKLPKYLVGTPLLGWMGDDRGNEFHALALSPNQGAADPLKHSKSNIKLIVTFIIKYYI